MKIVDQVRKLAEAQNKSLEIVNSLTFEYDDADAYFRDDTPENTIVYFDEFYRLRDDAKYVLENLIKEFEFVNPDSSTVFLIVTED